MRGKGAGFPASRTNGPITDAFPPLRHLLIVSLDFLFQIDNTGLRFVLGSEVQIPEGLAPFFTKSSDSFKGGGVSV